MKAWVQVYGFNGTSESESCEIRSRIFDYFAIDMFVLLTYNDHHEQGHANHNQ